jgi:hypothetical protein
VDLKLDVGEGGLDYAEVAKKEHLSELEVEIRKLNDKVKDVLAEQTYQRQRELEFRKTSEAIHSKQQYWSLFQIAVMVAACYIQVSTLQHFFRVKKLGLDWSGAGDRGLCVCAQCAAAQPSRTPAQ